MGNIDSTEFHDLSKAIDSKHTTFQHSFLNRKFSDIAQLFTKDCRFMPAGFPLQNGRKGIADFYSQMADLGFYKISFETSETIGPMDNMASERGTYSFENGDGKELQHGNYMAIWKKEDDEWRYHYDVWNADHMEFKKE